MIRRIVLLFFLVCTYWILSAQTEKDFFYQKTDTFFKSVVQDGLIDYQRIKDNPSLLNELVTSIENFDRTVLFSDLALLVNVYNLLLINQIIQHYPVPSPKDIPRFFDKKVISLSKDKSSSLNELETNILSSLNNNPLLHFVLVCGAKGCPEIASFAYRQDGFYQQMEQQTRLAINNPNFIRINSLKKTVQISPIFLWYEKHFGNPPISFINKYLEQPIPEDYSVKYYTYDWTLNDSRFSDQVHFMPRYMASNLLSKQQGELKLFNALYTQKSFDGFEHLNSRSSYFSSFGQVLIGTNKNFNWGFDIVYKSNLENDFSTSSPFQTLGFKRFTDFPILDCSNENHHQNNGAICTKEGTGSNFTDTLRNSMGISLERRSNHGLAHIGPKIKFQPIQKWKHLSLQQTFYFPINKSVDGQFISFTQFFMDFMLSPKSTLFIEASLWTPIRPSFRINPFFKVFYSYFPTNRWTLYAMTTIPFEYGLGTKYLLAPNLEIELLYTHYAPIELFVGQNRPNTFNLGFRYTIF